MRSLRHFFFLLVLGILVHPAVAQERLALVIGNQGYEHSRKLVNPVNDAIAMRGRLQEAGFEVTLLQDANHEIFERTLKDFSLRLKPESVAVVYFAGHGMQTGGVTYLLPVDADADAAESLKYEAVALDLVLDLLDRGGQGAGLKFVILDCCRNDPFGRGWRGDRDASAETGLAAPSSTPSGTVLCYATDPGKVASDGRGVNSPYTDGLVKHLFTPGLDFDLALRRVGAEVQAATGRKQNPWRNANFNGSFAFVTGTERPGMMVKPTGLPAALPFTDVPAAASINLSDQDFAAIGNKLWLNACGGTLGGLTMWYDGMDSPFLGIGNFIWYAPGLPGHDYESFPPLLDYMKSRSVVLPAWLAGGKGCPWPSRAEFTAAQQSPQMKELRQLLANSFSVQTGYMVQRLEQSLPQMQAITPVRADKGKLRTHFYLLASSRNGLYALIDYVNFKGEGVSPEEKYQGEGWGLRDVLLEMPSGTTAADATAAFSEAAKRVLQRRVKNSPTDRDSRWLAGWLKRCETYKSGP